MSEEVFPGGIAEGGTDEIGGMLRAVGGHEVGPHVVVGAPNVDVVHEGIGNLCGGDESQGTILVAMERLGETFSVDTTIVEPSRETVVRHDIGEVRIGQFLDEADAVVRLAPKFFGTMVTVLKEESAAVDGIVDGVARCAPVGEVRHGLGDIIATARPEIVEYGVRVLVCGPAASRCTFINGILADGVLAKFVFPETVHDFRAKLEPAFQLESHGSDGLVVEVGIGGRLAFVVEVFLNHVIHLVVVASRDARHNDFGHVAIVHHRIGMVGDIGIIAVATRMVVHRVGDDALGAVRVVVAQNEHCCGWHVPSIVGVADEVSNGRKVVAAAFAHGETLGGDALLNPEFFDAVGQRDEFVVVGCDNHVLATCLAVFIMLAKSFAVIDLRQYIMVEDNILKDLIPFRGTITRVAIL